MLRIVELDRGEAKSSIWQRGIVGHRRYPTVRLGAPAKLKYLHSKIGRRVDLARVRYGTMQSERRRLGPYQTLMEVWCMDPSGENTVPLPATVRI